MVAGGQKTPLQTSPAASAGATETTGNSGTTGWTSRDLAGEARPATNAPLQEDAAAQRAPDESQSNLEMSRYIDLRVYHEVERTHPFYVEMIDEIRQQLRLLMPTDREAKVWEFGAGTGLATEELLRFENFRVLALDFDDECCGELNGFLGRNERLSVVQGDAVEYRCGEPQDLAISVFAHDHISYDRGRALASNIRKNLVKGGYYIMGGEILSEFETSEERREALYRYHGFVVNKAMRDENFRVAQIEINALESGLNWVGDFKRHEAMFENEVTSANLRIKQKIKIGPSAPSHVGGVFVYVFQAV